VRSRIAWERIAPSLNPVDPQEQILYLPTWIRVDNSSGIYTEFVSLPQVAPWGTIPTATATPIGMVWYPGDGENPALCANTLGAEWRFGDDETLNAWEQAGRAGTSPLPLACRYRYRDLPPQGSDYTARIALRYRIVYTGLTRPMSVAPCSFAGTYTCTEIYDAPATPIAIGVREQVAVNVPNEGAGGAGSTN
jgi:hypothetical protein